MARWLYQGRTNPREHEALIPSFSWFLQQADVVRPLHQTRSGFFALVEFSVPIVEPDFGWFVQASEPLPLPILREGLYARTDVVAPPPVEPDFGWFVQEPDVSLAPKQILPGLFSFVEVVEAPVPTPEEGERVVIAYTDVIIGRNRTVSY